MRASHATCHHAGRCNTPGTSPGPAFADTMEIMESSRTFAGAHVGLCAVVMLFEFLLEGGQAPYGANALAVNVGTFVLASWSVVVVVPPTHPSIHPPWVSKIAHHPATNRGPSTVADRRSAIRAGPRWYDPQRPRGGCRGSH